MTKVTKPRKRATGRFTLGRQNFAKISAVEGIQLTSEMAQDFKDFDRRGLSPGERRREIARKYGKARI